MKALLSLEEIAKLLLAYVGSLYLDFSWWVFPALFLLPDLSMLNYLFNPRVGAWLYNLLHHQALGIAIGLAGFMLAQPEWQLAGLIIFGHSAMDRAFGYGLKYTDSFKHTHLGWIAKQEKQPEKVLPFKG